jgi:gliding motility-associated protein GldC
MKKSEIKFTVTLDENNMPDTIQWAAEGSGVEGTKAAKSLMISLWDPADQGTMRIDLWTKQMTVEEMRRFFFESLTSMADTYRRSTNDDKEADAIRAFAREFGKAAGVLK